jgi:hypothetical protein
VTKALSVNDGKSASAICVPWTSLRAVSSCVPQQSHMQAPAKCQLTPALRNMHWSGLDTALVSALSHGVSVPADSLALSGRAHVVHSCGGSTHVCKVAVEPRDEQVPALWRHAKAHQGLLYLQQEGLQ